MAVTMQQVLVQLDREEPDYAEATRLGRGAVPHLALIVEADDPLRAAKAAYLATLIPGPEAFEVVRKAASHRDPQVRVSAAYGLRNAAAAGPGAGELVEKLLGDPDAGVRKLAVRTAGHLKRPELRKRVEAIANGDPAEFLRTAAAETLQKLDAR